MLRKTKQRTAIEAVLQNSDRPLSVHDLQREAGKDARGIGIATIYRTLKDMLEEGWIRKVDIPEKALHYEKAHLHHHHHFFCETCEQVFEIEACPPGVNTLAPDGFTVNRHEITLYGHCKGCQAGS